MNSVSSAWLASLLARNRAVALHQQARAVRFARA